MKIFSLPQHQQQQQLVRATIFWLTFDLVLKLVLETKIDTNDKGKAKQPLATLESPFGVLNW